MDAWRLSGCDGAIPLLDPDSMPETRMLLKDVVMLDVPGSEGSASEELLTVLASGRSFPVTRLTFKGPVSVSGKPAVRMIVIFVRRDSSRVFAVDVD
jgi:hypothetical protein